MQKTPRIAFYGAPDGVLLGLAEKLISLRCEAFAASNHSAWKQTGLPLAAASKEFEYAVVARESGMSLKWLESIPQSKVIILLPYVAKGTEALTTLQKVMVMVATHPHVRIVCVGDHYSAKMNLADPRPVAVLVRAIIKGEAVPFSGGTELFPIYLADAVEQLVRILFSYWQQAAPVALAEKVTAQEFVAQIKTRSVVFSLAEKPTTYSPAYTAHILPLRNKTTNALLHVLNELPKPVQQPVEVPAPTVSTVIAPAVQPVVKLAAPRPTKRKPIKRIKWAIGFVGIGLLLPFVSFALTLMLMGSGYLFLQKGNLPTTQSLFNLAGKTAKASERVFETLALIPVAGRLFDSFSHSSHQLGDLSQMGVRGVRIVQMGDQLITGVFTDADYDIESLSHNLSLELAALYEQSSFFQQDLSGGFVTSFLPSLPQWQQLRRYLLMGGRLTKQLPALIAGTTPKTYLVLLQNNMELRPSGGFIGSFALVTFEKGKLADTSVYDVYTADGQLKGHVEPPAPIRDYLGEANWYLRDSNWDPDFPSTALRAEWFLEKEMDRKVDGVVGVDLEVAKGLLQVTGPLTLADFNAVVDHKNVYEKIQHEVEDTFFPGSQKKATILTALTRELLVNLPRVQRERIPTLVEVLTKGLEGRHIQLAMHDKNVASILDESNWDGGVEPVECGRKCTPAWLGIAEANVGVNKANYYINRKVDVDIAPSGQSIAYTLKVTITNQSTQDLALGGRYKTYLRALALPGSTFAPIEIYNGKEVTFRQPEITGGKDRTEAGVVVDVPPKSTREIVFRISHAASIDFASSGELSIGIRKQAGTNVDPLAVRVYAPAGTTIYGNPAPSLTQGSNLGYNDSLETDFAARINW